MVAKWIPVAGALLAAGGVGLGAFGAHGLADALERLGRVGDLPKRVEWFDTAVSYQLYHALGLLILASLAPRVSTGAAVAIAAAFLVGIALFSGSLYAMTFAGDAWRKLGMVTPLGGLAFIIGWVMLAVSAWRH